MYRKSNHYPKKRWLIRWLLQSWPSPLSAPIRPWPRLRLHPLCLPWLPWLQRLMLQSNTGSKPGLTRTACASMEEKPLLIGIHPMIRYGRSSSIRLPTPIGPKRPKLQCLSETTRRYRKKIRRRSLKTFSAASTFRVRRPMGNPWFFRTAIRL